MIYDIRDVDFRYGATPVLHDVSARIDKGDFVAIVGPNGAGKSTLLKLLAGILPSSGGSIDFEGRPIADFKVAQLAQQIAFVAQETHVVFPFTVDEMILMGRIPYRQGFVFDNADDSEFVDNAMEMTQTSGLAGKMFNELSGGERQRVVLASALAQTPAVLLLDEPTVYLDMKHQLHFYRILERLNAERNMTVIAVTHDLNLAARYSRRMIAMRDGAIVADGEPEEILTSETVYEIFEIQATILDRPGGGGKYVIPVG